MKSSLRIALLLSTILLLITINLAAAQSGESNSPSLDRGKLHILESNAELSDEQIALLRSRGVELLEYRENGTYWIKTADAGTLHDLTFVKQLHRARLEDKVDTSLIRKASGLSQEERVTVTVTLFPEVNFENMRLRLESLGGKLKVNGLLFGRRLIAELPAGVLGELASLDMVRAVESGPREKITNNVRAANSSRISKVYSLFGLTGNGIVGGIWDEGAIDNHPDLVGNFELGESGKVSDHTTHVAGTIVGTGEGRLKARGMAPEAHLVSFNFKGDVPTEMAKAVKDYDILFANNSWSYANGWSYHYLLKLWIWWGDENFGKYNSESAAYDELVEKTDLVILFAAGNDRADKGTDEPYLDLTIKRGNTVPHPADGPYTSLDVTASAKNVITVGAVDRKGKMTSFSSWGPTRDGRLKPEIVADGQKVFSTLPDNQYGSYSGTSMATPVATGGIALLMQQFRQNFRMKATAAEIRALIAATAKDLGEKGPDFCYGFGLFDAYSAALLLDAAMEENLIIRDRVRKAKSERSKRYNVKVADGTDKLKIALAWIDPAAQPNARKTLVNDLDLRVYRKDGTEEELPWVLDGDNPAAPATKGINSIDNIELVEIDNPEAGEWVVEVRASNFGEGKRQEFALVINSNEPLGTRVEEIK